MGKLAEAVEELEMELSQCLIDLHDTQLELRNLEEELEVAHDTIKEQAAFISWVESYYTEAEQQYQALCKVRGT